MDKHYYTPLQLLKIATQHAYSAEYLLHHDLQMLHDAPDTHDPLLSIASLMYTAFQLTLKAYLLHQHANIKQQKTLGELLELNSDLALTSNEQQLLKNLSKQLAYRKGVDHVLWQDRQQQQVFCAELIQLYERLQELMPLELQSDYQPTN